MRTDHLKQLILAVIIGWVAGSAHAENVQITPQVCQQVVAHQPDASVNYQPGVDVNGNAVAPADLNGSAPIQVPEQIVLDIKIPVAPRNPGQMNAYTPEGSAGTVVVDTKTGQVFYNGQPVGGSDQERIYTLCRQRYPQ